MNPRLLLPLLFTVAGAGLHAADKHADEKPTTVRFLCVAPDIPSKLKKTPNGAYAPIPFGPDERPPMSLSVKEGETYKAVPFSRNGVSPETKLGKKTHADSGYYFQYLEPESPEAVLARLASPEKESAPPPEKKKVEWRQLADCPKPDGRDHLICLFNPNAKAKWYPPKTLDLDISESAFPAGRCMVANFSSKPVYVQVGEKTKPIPLAPGGTHTLLEISPDASGESRIKVAAALDNGEMSVVFNRSMPVSTQGRTIIAIHEAAPKMRSPVELKLFQFENPTHRETARTEVAKNLK